MKLIVPVPDKKKSDKWYEKYEKLNSSLFSWENSGQRAEAAPPYHAKMNEHFDTIDIEGKYGMDQVYKLLGYTENPPFPTKYPSVAIMFEDLHTHEKIWWHYMLT